MDISVALQVSLGALFAFMLEKAKNAPNISWLTTHTDVLNKVISLVVAILFSIGITYTWVTDVETGRGVLTLSGIPITMSLWIEIASRTMIQYWSSKLTYLGVIKNKAEGSTPATRQLKDEER